MTDQTGIPESVCEQVKSAHDKMTDLASVIPDKTFFRKSIWERFQDYAEAYSAWNDVDGSDHDAQARRKAALKEVRAKRNALATTVRKNKHILNEELDLKLIDDMYSALGDLAKSAPEYFSKLAEAVARYDKRRSN